MAPLGRELFRQDQGIPGHRNTLRQNRHKLRRKLEPRRNRHRIALIVNSP